MPLEGNDVASTGTTSPVATIAATLLVTHSTCSSGMVLGTGSIHGGYGATKVASAPYAAMETMAVASSSAWNS